MKIIMVAAISRDGFLTKGNNPNPASWTSEEDKKFFNDIKSKHNLFVMGRKTFDSGQVSPTKGTLKVILTRHLERYKNSEVKNQLVFRTYAPAEIVKIYEKIYDTCLLLGGSHVYEDFLNAKLIDEIYLTVEPEFNKTGIPLFKDPKTLIHLEQYLVNEKILNSKGTVLKHYRLKN